VFDGLRPVGLGVADEIAHVLEPRELLITRRMAAVRSKMPLACLTMGE